RDPRHPGRAESHAGHRAGLDQRAGRVAPAHARSAQRGGLQFRERCGLPDAALPVAAAAALPDDPLVGAPRYHTRRGPPRRGEGNPPRVPLPNGWPRRRGMSERELTYGEAVREAIAEEMRRDPCVCLIGEDVAEAGHPFKTLVGLVDEFGTKRVIDTPISEPGYAGIGVGAAMTGMRPIGDVMVGGFSTLTMDQMVNQAAKANYMSGGKIK